MVESYSCPSCNKPVKRGGVTFPFCSKRCQDLDLGSWFFEKFRISRALSPEEADELAEGAELVDESVSDDEDGEHSY